MDIVTDYIFKGLAVIASVIIVVGLVLSIIDTFKNRKIKKMVRTAEGARAYTKQYYEKLAPVSDAHKKILSKVVRDEIDVIEGNIQRAASDGKRYFEYIPHAPIAFEVNEFGKNYGKDAEEQLLQNIMLEIQAEMERRHFQIAQNDCFLRISW